MSFKQSKIDDNLGNERFIEDRPDTRKILSSYADVNSYWEDGKAIPTTISRDLIRRIARSSQTVAAILEHACNDIAGAGYHFERAEDVKKPSKAQYGRAVNFFKNPNPDDQGDEWLYDFVYDLLLYGDGYWEKEGTLDEQEDVKGKPKKCWFGGDLKAIWHVDASTMKILNVYPTGQMPDPESGVMAYEQQAQYGKVQFDTLKIARASRFRQGRLYGESPLLSLLNIIAGQINLTGYIGNLFKGNVPKHLLNVGGIDGSEFDSLQLSIQEQMEQATNPFGVIAINAPTGFQLQRLMETNREGAFLETLDYYKTEICGVFGIPPTKMGVSVAGRIGNPEEMLDTWYDKVERVHDRLEKVINRTIMTALGITDWRFKFDGVRPKKTKVQAQTLRDNATALKMLKQDNFITINEGRDIIGLDRIEEDWANDHQYPSPTLKPGNPGGLGTPHEGENILSSDIREEFENLTVAVESLKRDLQLMNVESKKDKKRVKD